MGGGQYDHGTSQQGVGQTTEKTKKEQEAPARAVSERRADTSCSQEGGGGLCECTFEGKCAAGAGAESCVRGQEVEATAAETETTRCVKGEQWADRYCFDM